MNYIDTIHSAIVEYVREKEKTNKELAKKVMVAWLELRQRLVEWEKYCGGEK